MKTIRVPITSQAVATPVTPIRPDASDGKRANAASNPRSIGVKVNRVASRGCAIIAPFMILASAEARVAPQWSSR